MKKISVLVVTLMVTSLFVISYNLSIGVTAQEDEEAWDFTGTMRITSDQVKRLVFDPVANGFNETYGDYDTPSLYMDCIGFDTDEDQEMDIYYGFYGVSLFDLVHINYTMMNELYRIVVFSQWSLRIPESSPLKWEVLYYPDPFYDSLTPNLIQDIPIYYVNLTKFEGVNLQFKYQLGLNYTIGNFTTFGAGNPIVPSMPTFPGYNVSVPVFTDNQPISELVATPFFSDPLTYLTIVTLSFLLGIYVKKRRKGTK
ncbi:MAG: hypothetical protein HeimAB125_21820 [Candidatus Heimdallarchaeota archaeon AB_125]|nr:MAG: hypothetical protein HeimAB125_21820 [Candidatus Heimdallarchaeota archaeon AB_125]